MVEARNQLAQDLKGFEIDPYEEEAEKCSKSLYNLIETWRRTKGNFEAVAAALKERLTEGDVIGSADSIIRIITFSKLSRAILVELRITARMLNKMQARVAQLGNNQFVITSLRSALEEALQQLKGEAAALKKRLASDPEAIRMLVEARENLARDCKTFVVSPGEKAWKECTARLGMLVDSWAAVRGAIMAAVEELRGKARDTDLGGGAKSAVVLARLLRGALLELLVLIKALGAIQKQVQGMEGVEGATRTVAEAALKKAREQLKAIRAALMDTSAEQILEGAELQQLRAEAAVDEGGILLDYAEMLVQGLSTIPIPGVQSVCEAIRGAIGAAKNAHTLASDALEMTGSMIEIGRNMRYMKRLANRMDEEAKQELQYEMRRLTKLLGEMKDAIETFGQKGYFRKMFAATKVMRRLASMERRKEAIMSAMDRVLQRVQTKLNLDQRDRVQLETKEHTYALEEAVCAKVEERTKANGGAVDVEADVSEAAEEIMRDRDALQEVADSAGLSEETFKEEMELMHETLKDIKRAVHGEGIQTRADMDAHYDRSGQVRLDDKKAELSGLARDYRTKAFGFGDLQMLGTAQTQLGELIRHPSRYTGNAVLSPTARTVQELQAKGVTLDELQSLVLPDSPARSPMSDDGRSGDGASSVLPRRTASAPLRSEADSLLVPPLSRALSAPSSHGADGSEIGARGANTVGVFCCVPYTDSQSSEVVGAARLEGEREVLVATEGARILSPASIESMEDAIAQSNPRGVHIAGHNQVQFVHLLLILTLTRLSIHSTAPTRCGSSAFPAPMIPTAMGMISSPSAHPSCSLNILWNLHSRIASDAGSSSSSSIHATRSPSRRYAAI
jgi:hypothetical protein